MVYIQLERQCIATRISHCSILYYSRYYNVFKYTKEWNESENTAISFQCIGIISVIRFIYSFVWNYLIIGKFEPIIIHLGMKKFYLNATKRHNLKKKIFGLYYLNKMIQRQYSHESYQISASWILDKLIKLFVEAHPCTRFNEENLDYTLAKP